MTSCVVSCCGCYYSWSASYPCVSISGALLWTRLHGASKKHQADNRWSSNVKSPLRLHALMFYHSKSRFPGVFKSKQWWHTQNWWVHDAVVFCNCNFTSFTSDLPTWKMNVSHIFNTNFIKQEVSRFTTTSVLVFSQSSDSLVVFFNLLDLFHPDCFHVVMDLFD